MHTNCIQFTPTYTNLSRVQENLASDEPSDLIERFVEATRSLGPSEIRAAAGISPQALARYRGGDFKRIFASTRRKIESYLAQHAIPGGEAYNSVSPDIIQAVRTEAVEHIQRALEVLEGRRVHLTEDPTPVDDRVMDEEERRRELEADLERMRAQAQRTEEELERLRAQRSETVVADGLTDETEPDAKPISVHRLQTAADSGAFDLDETVKTYAYFRSEWLFRKGLTADRCNIIGVAGESMEPTLPDGCVILVDRNRTKRYRGHIFVVRTEDGLVVKRAGKDEGGGWQLVSDHPEWKPQPWPYGAEVIGEVKWMAREL